MCSKRLMAAFLIAFIPMRVIAGDAPTLGQFVSPEELNAISLTVLPDGQGLPEGTGTAKNGETIYAAQCASCHGVKGVNGPLIAMAGKPKRVTDWTVGTVYEHATSIFDYVRRAMPAFTPKRLTNEDVYSVTAYILYLNGLVEIDEPIDRETLPKITMPASAYSHSKWEEERKP